MSVLSNNEPAPAVQHKSNDKNPLLFDPKDAFKEPALELGRPFVDVGVAAAAAVVVVVPDAGGGDLTYSGLIGFLPFYLKL